MSKDGKTWFSHTNIETLDRCPRCFWLMMRKGVKQPEGIQSRLANRFDSILKKYFNLYRQSDELPPIIEGKVKGKLQNPFQEAYFVHLDNKYGFYGKLDECLIDEGKFIPVDFKTSSSDPRLQVTLPAYQRQIEDYLFIMSKNGKPVANFGYIIYVFPDHSAKLHDGFPMVVHVLPMKDDINPARTLERINHAIEIMESNIPLPKEDCNFCKYVKAVNQIEKELISSPGVVVASVMKQNNPTSNANETDDLPF